MKAKPITSASMKPVAKQWHDGFKNQAVYQTPGFYTVHEDYHFNLIWLGTDPQEAEELLVQINDCRALATR